MTLGEVIHHLVDNSAAFTDALKIDAHKAIADHFGETELHPMVPSPEAEAAMNDEKAQKIAELRAQIAALDPEPAGS
jgi:hypothetical protein